MWYIKNDNGAFVEGVSRKIVKVTEKRSDAMQFATEEVALVFIKKEQLSNAFFTSRD
jgi:hypothetical protein